MYSKARSLANASRAFVTLNTCAPSLKLTAAPQTNPIYITSWATTQSTNTTSSNVGSNVIRASKYSALHPHFFLMEHFFREITEKHSTWHFPMSMNSPKPATTFSKTTRKTQDLSYGQSPQTTSSVNSLPCAQIEDNWTQSRSITLAP